MPIIGIIAKIKDFKLINREFKNKNVKIILINEKNINNLKNIQFDEIIFMKDINLTEITYKYMKQIISNVKYLIINSDVKISNLEKLSINKPVKIITFGFNSKTTVTISSINEEKIVLSIQRNIEKVDKKIIETQEKVIEILNNHNKNVYNNLAVFIINEIHNYHLLEL